jgi:hypothetical protein
LSEAAPLTGGLRFELADPTSLLRRPTKQRSFKPGSPSRRRGR